MELIFVMGAPVKENGEPGEEFKLRLDKTLEIYSSDKNMILIAGRVGHTLNKYPITQAECGKNYLLKKGLHENKMLMETISCETAGNFAFSGPIISKIKPDRVIVVTSEYGKQRVAYLANKILGRIAPINLECVVTVQSSNPNSKDRENKAFNMFKTLFENVVDGDYLKIIDTLLLQTPFYNKNLIKDEDFFNKYWNPGGWEDFIRNKNLVNELSISNQ